MKGGIDMSGKKYSDNITILKPKDLATKKPSTSKKSKDK